MRVAINWSKLLSDNSVTTKIFFCLAVLGFSLSGENLEDDNLDHDFLTWPLICQYVGMLGLVLTLISAIRQQPHNCRELSAKRSPSLMSTLNKRINRCTDKFISWESKEKSKIILEAYREGFSRSFKSTFSAILNVDGNSVSFCGLVALFTAAGFYLECTFRNSRTLFDFPPRKSSLYAAAIGGGTVIASPLVFSIARGLFSGTHLARERLKEQELNFALGQYFPKEISRMIEEYQKEPVTLEALIL